MGTLPFTECNTRQQKNKLPLSDLKIVAIGACLECQILGMNYYMFPSWRRGGDLGKCESSCVETVCLIIICYSLEAFLPTSTMKFYRLGLEKYVDALWSSSSCKSFVLLFLFPPQFFHLDAFKQRELCQWSWEICIRQSGWCRFISHHVYLLVNQ